MILEAGIAGRDHVVERHQPDVGREVVADFLLPVAFDSPGPMDCTRWLSGRATLHLSQSRVDELRGDGKLSVLEGKHSVVSIAHSLTADLYDGFVRHRARQVEPKASSISRPEPGLS